MKNTGNYLVLIIGLSLKRFKHYNLKLNKINENL